MNRLALYFSGEKQQELVRTSFFCSLVGAELKTQRGKGAFGILEGSFQWTQSVQAVAILFLKTLITKISNDHNPNLSGVSGTPASSLDYTLSKPPTWMLDMFGCSSSGEPMVRRLFRRANPEQKLPGPVIISVNESFLNPEQIQIYINNIECKDAGILIRLVESIEQSWKPARASNASFNYASAASSFEHVTPQLKSAFESEINYILKTTEIFTDRGIRSVSQRMVEDISNAGLSSGNHKNLFRKFQLSHLSSKDRFGIVEQDKDLFSDLKVACPLGSPSALAIFSHMQLKHSFQIDYAYQHALELMYLLVKNKLSYVPELVVLGTAPAAIFSENCHTLGYRPLMILPGMTHRVLKSKRRNRKAGSQKLVSGSQHFLMLNSDPSTSVMYFKRLKAQKQFETRLSKITHAEPDEIFSALSSGDDDVRSVLYFPYYEMNRVFNGSELIDTPKDISNIKDSVLFIHESADTDPVRTGMLERVIRNSWLTMREQPSEVTKTVGSLFDQEQFTTYLKRSSGLFQLA